MKKLILSIALVSAALWGAHASAQTPAPFCQNGTCTYVALEPLPGLPNCFGPGPYPTDGSCVGTTNSFGALVTGAFKLLLGAGGTIAVVMLVVGALTYMFSDVLKNKVKALNRIRNAMWAIVLLISSYLILSTINPDLVKLDFSPTTLNTTGAAPATTAPAAQQTTSVASNTVTPGSYSLSSADTQEVSNWATMNGYLGAIKDTSGNVVGTKSGLTIDDATSNSLLQACNATPQPTGTGYKVAADCSSSSCTFFCALVP